MNQFQITWRCDQEEVFCTDSMTIESFHCDVIEMIQDPEFVQKHLSGIMDRNTIIRVERIV